MRTLEIGKRYLFVDSGGVSFCGSVQDFDNHFIRAAHPSLCHVNIDGQIVNITHIGQGVMVQAWSRLEHVRELRQ